MTYYLSVRKVTLQFEHSSEEGWAGSRCELCAANFFPPGRCDAFCDSQKTCGGHGACDRRVVMFWLALVRLVHKVLLKTGSIVRKISKWSVAKPWKK